MRLTFARLPLAARLLMLAFLLISSPRPSSGTEVKWTPADDGASAAASADGGAAPTSGPLPLSQNQRDQLTQLEQAIMSSPDPQSTLMQVAQSNSMSPEDLVDLLQRNRSDMEMAGGGGGGGGMAGGRGSRTLPRQIIGLFGTLLAAMGKVAQSHPRNFSLIVATLLLATYASIQAPRTGVVLSSYAKPFGISSGHSTLFVPPTSYVTAFLESDRYGRSVSSLPRSVEVGSTCRSFLEGIVEGLDVDGTTFGDGKVKKGRKSRKKKKSMPALSVTARRSVPIGSLFPRSSRSILEDDDEDEQDLDEEREVSEYAAFVAHEAAASVLSSRRFTEFVPDPTDLRFQSGGVDGDGDGGEDAAMLVVKAMGDLGRYGLQPLRVAYEGEEEEGGDVESVVFYTLGGGHFDGEIRFSVERRGGYGSSDDDGDVDGEGQSEEGERSDEDDGVIISVSIVVPKKGRKPSKKMAKRIVSLLAESIVTSVATEAKQTIARQSMSQKYRGRMEGRASERRHLRFMTEKKMEEMAEDRRRRWQRRNPDAGRYRPSGERMRSPNNC